MWEIWDSLNAVGIVFQLVGFIILLERLKGFIYNLISSQSRHSIRRLALYPSPLDVINNVIAALEQLKIKYARQLKNGVEQVEDMIDHAEHQIHTTVMASWIKSREAIGIAFVIIGLLLQFIALLLEKAAI